MNHELKLLIYYIVINTLVYLLIGFDKQRASSYKRRIPESTLWLFSVLGGSFGLYLGMHAYHHKTRKLQFRIGASFLCFLHSVLIILLVLQF